MKNKKAQLRQHLNLRRISEEGEHIFAVQVENNRWMIYRRKFEEYLKSCYFSVKKYEGYIPAKVF